MLKATKANNKLQILPVNSSEMSTVLEKGPEQTAWGPKVSSCHICVGNPTKATFPLFQQGAPLHVADSIGCEGKGRAADSYSTPIDKQQFVYVCTTISLVLLSPHLDGL